MATLPIKVGILGGGQLARMLALAAYPLGIQPFLFVKSLQECAVDVAADVVIDDGGDECLKKFVDKVDFLALENEFIDLERTEGALRGKSLLPNIPCLRLVQDKLQQKKHLKRLKIPTMAFRAVENERDFDAISDFKNGFVLKKARLGYDGRGTFVFKNKKSWNQREFLRDNPGFSGYVEEYASFKKEIAVVVARSITGKIQAYPVIETSQEGEMCQWAAAPASIPRDVAHEAARIGQEVIKKFDGVGIFAIEMFWLGGKRVMVNEIAPRVHNSGHWTMNGSHVSQFEQHWRALLGAPLGKIDMTSSAAAMINIIGEMEKTDATTHTEMAFKKLSPGAWLHWYGKQGNTFGRKLGHINALGATVAGALKQARLARKLINV